MRLTTCLSTRCGFTIRTTKSLSSGTLKAVFRAQLLRLVHSFGFFWLLLESLCHSKRDSIVCGRFGKIGLTGRTKLLVSCWLSVVRCLRSCLSQFPHSLSSLLPFSQRTSCGVVLITL